MGSGDALQTAVSTDRSKRTLPLLFTTLASTTSPPGINRTKTSQDIPARASGGLPQFRCTFCVISAMYRARSASNFFWVSPATCCCASCANCCCNSSLAACWRRAASAFAFASSSALRLASAAALRLASSSALRFASSSARRLASSSALRLTSVSALRFCSASILRLLSCSAKRFCRARCLSCSARSTSTCCWCWRSATCCCLRAASSALRCSAASMRSSSAARLASTTACTIFSLPCRLGGGSTHCRRTTSSSTSTTCTRMANNSARGFLRSSVSMRRNLRRRPDENGGRASAQLGRRRRLGEHPDAGRAGLLQQGHRVHHLAVVGRLIAAHQHRQIGLAAQHGGNALHHVLHAHRLLLLAADVEIILALGIHGQHQRFFGLLIDGLRRGLRQVHLHALRQQRRGDHKYDQQHQHHVDVGHDVDLRHQAFAIARSRRHRRCPPVASFISLTCEPGAARRRKIPR